MVAFSEARPAGELGATLLGRLARGRAARAPPLEAPPPPADFNRRNNSIEVYCVEQSVNATPQFYII